MVNTDFLVPNFAKTPVSVSKHMYSSVELDLEQPR